MGFPSPAQDYRVKTLDINEHIIQNPDTTFYFAVENNAMKGDDITMEHKVAVDRSIDPKSGHIIVAVVGEEFYIRRLQYRGNKAYLRASWPGFKTIVLDKLELQVWGVVVGSFRSHIKTE